MSWMWKKQTAVSYNSAERKSENGKKTSIALVGLRIRSIFTF